MQPIPQDHPYFGLSPGVVWRQFAALNAIPRPSRQEAAAREYVRRRAADSDAPARTDRAGNVVVSLPPTAGCEASPVTAVQAHLDMVCEKRPEIAHDFSRDPIRPRRAGEWIYATGTTLGADNGMGAAMALALLEDTPGRHGPIELVFTVEEEIGLHGAAALDRDLIHARFLINLDSEDPREITIGCAGGAGADLTLPAPAEPVEAGWEATSVTVGGLKGGHSGVQIHEPLANALKLLGAILRAGGDAVRDWRLASVTGGNARNAIPRDAHALFLTPAGWSADARRAMQAQADRLREEWGDHEPGVSLRVEPAPQPATARGHQASQRLLFLLAELPHGVLAWSRRFPGKVETSANLALVETGSESVRVHLSTRSFQQEALETLAEGIVEIARDAGARLVMEMGYGPWPPRPAAFLTRQATRAYRAVTGAAPDVQVIHAGLECAVIAAKRRGMQAVSFGPRIEAAHTPEERLHIPSVETSWKLLHELLAMLAAPPAGSH